MSRVNRAVAVDTPSPSVLTHGRPHTHSELTLPLGVVAAPPSAASKPPYRVPSMAEIAAVPDTGYRVVSLFSGCGGSCLGFEMAGYRVRWASEFIPAAAETYRANHPAVHLDTSDIRTVSATAILQTIALAPGAIDVLEGSPPCASFSTAGKREDGWGKVKAYSDTRQRVDDLFFEYARLLGGLQPKVFVAENVSGLVKGTAKGYFKEILAALKTAGPTGYVVEARLLDAQWLGVPQMRQRIIFVGVRRDLAEGYGVRPMFPKPLRYRYSVREALPWIVAQADNGGFGGGAMRDAGQHASPTIGATPQTGNGAYPPALVEAIEPETDLAGYAIGREWDQLKPGERSDRYFQLERAHLDTPSPTVAQRGGDARVATVTHPTERRKFTIAELKRICAFPDDFILTGTYAQQWERLGRAVPPVMMFHVARVLKEEILCRIPRP